MLTRRQFLERTLKTSSLVALSTAVPGFVANTARAAEPGKDTILVVLEMTGGNDGLNTVVPFGDDLYHKARPTLKLTKEQVVRIDDHIGLNPGLRGLQQLLGNKQVAVVQGVGYPNADRSHFESMDIWQSADPKRKTANGWLGRGLSLLQVKEGHMPALHLGSDKLPLALQGSSAGVPSIHPNKRYELELGKPETAKAEREAQAENDRAARRRLIQELAEMTPASEANMLQFVQRSSLQTYTTIEHLRQFTRDPNPYAYGGGAAGRRGELAQNLYLIARMIQAGYGTRVFYTSIDGFDTHAGQAQPHQDLLRELADSVNGFFNQLQNGGHAKRVLLMTFSEFGRRVRENGSRGTDHGAGSCLFVIGPGAKGGLVGEHPSLDDLDSGDLKHHTDFRQVYATLLDKWLECDSRRVLGGEFKHVALLK